MSSDEEFEAFVKQNKAAIEKMMEMQKKATLDLVTTEKTIAKEALGQAKGFAEQGRTMTEEVFKGIYNTFMDPAVQRHFMNMGAEFFMGVSAIMQKMPMPDTIREGIQTTQSNFKTTACRNNEECAVRKAKKVDISIQDDKDPRDVPKDVF